MTRQPRRRPPARCYEVIEAGNLGLLQSLVHDKICAGKIPLGGVTIVPRKDAMGFVPIYLQTVCAPAVLMAKTMADGQALAQMVKAIQAAQAQPAKRKRRRR